MTAKALILATAVVGAAVTGACNAHADVPTFPDISGYAPVNAQDYTIALPNTGRAPLNMVYFLTPDGITCAFGNPPSAACTGNNFPAVPPASGDSVNSISTSTGLGQTNAPIAAQGRPIKTLPPMHSITVNGVICGVDGGGTTACKDPQGQGFVLSPSGSGWLPHV
ncbi:hypothetical protein MFM001_35820 [Mycobacterium sp. MFM001]|uniref:hypothetical protein n=1 Tax=Mycobacterium sp. MFM001 TaxID=2049453 RepID=UPI000DA4B864|nr:hypothetical protein [Mycobacterium sp. MFM001]GBE67120.1 hypothetical protein MFM001_35820 [Mycobacterium sp. MFM001]